MSELAPFAPATKSRPPSSPIDRLQKAINDTTDDVGEVLIRLGHAVNLSEPWTLEPIEGGGGVKLLDSYRALRARHPTAVPTFHCTVPSGVSTLSLRFQVDPVSRRISQIPKREGHRRSAPTLAVAAPPATPAPVIKASAMTKAEAVKACRSASKAMKAAQTTLHRLEAELAGAESATADIEACSRAIAALKAQRRPLAGEAFRSGDKAALEKLDVQIAEAERELVHLTPGESAEAAAEAIVAELSSAEAALGEAEDRYNSSVAAFLRCRSEETIEAARALAEKLDVEATRFAAIAKTMKMIGGSDFADRRRGDSVRQALRALPKEIAPKRPAAIDDKVLADLESEIKALAR